VRLKAVFWAKVRYLGSLFRLGTLSTAFGNRFIDRRHRAESIRICAATSQSLGYVVGGAVVRGLHRVLGGEKENPLRVGRRFASAAPGFNT
jgi:hypothetical protein